MDSGKEVLKKYTWNLPFFYYGPKALTDDISSSSTSLVLVTSQEGNFIMSLLVERQFKKSNLQKQSNALTKHSNATMYTDKHRRGRPSMQSCPNSLRRSLLPKPMVENTKGGQWRSLLEYLGENHKTSWSEGTKC
jgi:hypothetical protein